LATTPAGEAAAAAALSSGGWRSGSPLLGLGVGSSFGPSKLWTSAAFAEVGNAFLGKGWEVALLHGPGEEGIAREVAGGLARPPVVPPDRPLGIAALKSVCRRLTLCVTTDTGPRHVAVAFGVPVVVVMGPTDPRYTECNLSRTVVLREEVDCAPYRWPCHEKACPLEGARHHRCMARIPAARAIAAAEGLLRASSRE
jgi:heptosyltransferase-2